MNNKELRDQLPADEQKKVSVISSVVGAMVGFFRGARGHYRGRDLHLTVNDMRTLSQNGWNRGLFVNNNINENYQPTVADLADKANNKDLPRVR